MPAFAAKKKADGPVKFGEAIPAPPVLRDEIEKLHSKLYAAFEELLDAMKQTRDGAGLPREILRQQLMAHDPCVCKVMMRLLANE